MNKKKTFKQFAYLGLTGAVLLTHQLSAAQTNPSQDDYIKQFKDSVNNDLSKKMLSEDELLEQLDANGKRQYKSLDPQGKQLAREIASQKCAGLNDCKGRNVCKSDKNACEGQADCKGKSICGATDKNQAVRIAAKKMAEKRNKANNGS